MIIHYMELLYIIYSLTANSISATKVSENLVVHNNSALGCRRNCIEEFGTKSRMQCGITSQCSECVQMCERLVRDYSTWSYPCRRVSLCGKGCLTACRYIKEEIDIMKTRKSRVKRNRLIQVQFRMFNHTFKTVLMIRQVPDSTQLHQVPYFFKIYRHNCNVYPDIQKVCQEGSAIYNQTQTFSSDKKQINMTFDKFWYNTDYEIKVYKVVGGQNIWIEKIEFITPRCPSIKMINGTFRYCLNTLESTISPVLSERIEATISAITHGSQDGKVIVSFTWKPVFNSSDAEYSLNYESVKPTFVNHKEKATAYGVNATLEQGRAYEILITAISGNRKVASKQWSLSPKDLMIAKKRQDLPSSSYLLTNTYNSSSTSTNMSTISLVEMNKRWIIGSVCIGCVVMIIIAALVIYKRRKDMKDTKTVKNFPLQCNNYMYKNTAYAAVSNKQYYTNDMVYVADEWEIDPSLLEISCTLGQGAFGKVLTAYYEGNRVAVKVVKEGAPVTYKEDLIAEIEVMKKLGSHPNIVSFIGSCTINEPIALVMEYVPYGNLQSFLKKCRLENELRRKGGEGGEMVYTIIDAHGSIEEGVITPADILTFARQIAMAMDYLAEKKYVHRDLAARNVLLGYNKVVKVCDFGLSRDIFNDDNHYKKLTSGKLPIKWMALESLRDRVFTTSSDVWSFGILLWEIVTMGASPYPHVALSDLFYLLSNRYRMDKPSNCSADLYVIMRWCWAERPQDRPTFSELQHHIETLLTKDCNYLDLDGIDVPLENDNSSSDVTTPLSSEISFKATISRLGSNCLNRNDDACLKRDSFVDPMPLELTEFRDQLDKMKSTNI